MVQYDLSHLTQQNNQDVIGPIQDDEALFIYSMIRGMRLKRILEIGGLNGYSGTNFCKATEDIPNSQIYTIDINPVPIMGTNHKCIEKNAVLIEASDIDNEPLNLVFFDCHDYNVQMILYHRLKDMNMITDKTVLMLHDTNLHPYQRVPWSYPLEDGFVHQTVERQMVNTFKLMGYDIFSIKTSANQHDENLPFRHGVTVCQRFFPMFI